MIQDNASFTFLHRIEEVELNIEDGRWQLRCEYLHQNKGFANTEDNTSIRFHLGVNCGTSVCQLDRIGSDSSLTTTSSYFFPLYSKEKSDVASTADW